MQKVKDTTEEKILRAAKNIFMKYGLYGARMQDISDTAGINKALLHYYFRSKEKLFDKVFEGALNEYFQQMDVFSDSSIHIKERLFKYIDNIFAFLTEYPQMSMFIIKEISSDPELFKAKVLEIKKTKRITLIQVLEQAIDAGDIKKMDPILFFVNLHSLCSYPFIAESIFKHVLKVHNKDWDNFKTETLKQSVKHFVESSLRL